MIRTAPGGAATAYARLPYGQTFFQNPTGRCSDGLLMIDYIAIAAGLPLLPPYKNTGADLTRGVNFAVAGATALPAGALAARGIVSPATAASLSVQLDWMSSYFNSTCFDESDCTDRLETALFMVGEIGGNDYNYAIFQGKSMDEVRSMVPEVVAAILKAAKKVIEFGATRIVIPGNFPIGCFPIYKTAFQSNIPEAYDEKQCLKHLNKFAMYHNEELRKGIAELRQEYIYDQIVYGDYYNAFEYVLEVAGQRGLDTQRACCGQGGMYNFEMGRMCGAVGVPVCPNPEKYVSWDGVHLTQEAYKIMAQWLLSDIFANLRCTR
ncbi:GDSL esterase/lipase At5g03980-like [Andrographis paniculata]|uniref:GDSL esterase/lipase At5g03980-like n=1 Tax=Andrographis paniculata TaxID=175694 RepID=UPI0021E8C3C2|nr:GDSL esterase/lipase At5g03980-like [Andrographis paniculata]